MTLINPRNEAMARRAAEARLRVQLSFERAMAKLIAKEFGIVANAAQAGFESMGVEGIDVPWTEHVIRMGGIIRSSMSAQLDFFGDDTIKSLMNAGIFERPPVGTLDAFNMAAHNHVATIGAREVVRVTNTTRDVIKGAIDKGLTEGLTRNQIGKEIWNNTTGDIGMRRARIIATTETHTSAMCGDFYAMEATGFAFTKQWLTFIDQRTRDHHKEVDGQERAKDAPFDVGGEELRWPGDPNASAANIINCRCQMVYNID